MDNKFKFLIALAGCLFLVPTVISVSDFVFSLSIMYDGENMTNEGLNLVQGIAPTRLEQPPETGFTLKVISSNEKVLYSFKFILESRILQSPPREIFSENGTQISTPQDKPLELKNISTTLVIPYFEDGDQILIYDPNNKLLLSVDISKYAKNKESQIKEENISYSLIGAAIISLLVIGLLIFKTIKNKNLTKKENIIDRQLLNAKKSNKPVVVHGKNYCAYCGNKLIGHEKFCSQCGKDIKAGRS